MISNFLHYQVALAILLAKRDIDWDTWRFAAWNRPIVVCGRTGTWVVDIVPEAVERTIRNRALVQFIIGMLMVAGAIAWFAGAVESGDLTLLLVDGLKALLLICLGLALALDATYIATTRLVCRNYPGAEHRRMEAEKQGGTPCKPY